jgi:hypothetical protein
MDNNDEWAKFEHCDDDDENTCLISCGHDDCDCRFYACESGQMVMEGV